MTNVASLIAGQHVLLNSETARLEILNQNLSRGRFGRKTIRVFRNHNFELMAPVLSSFAKYSGFEIEFLIGSYDDSMSFQDFSDREVDADMLWFDYSHYDLTEDSLLHFVVSRVKALRELSTAPIFICDSPNASHTAFNEALGEIAKEIPGTLVLPVSECAQKLGDDFYDDSRSAYFGTRFHSRALTAIARVIGLCYLPAVLRPRIKAIAIDLDNTLYSGVLGEDGVTGLGVTDGHLRLQEELVKLGEAGILLSIVSKNIKEDVEALFSTRNDFILRPEHLAGMQINWDSKASNITKLAAAFNISPNDFLLLDDNLGELGQTLAEINLIDIMHASDDPGVTAAELKVFPGLHSFGLTREDKLRTKDILSRQQRSMRQNTQSYEEYLSQLDTEIEISLNQEDAYTRLCELPIKTNQFNLALQRLNATEVAWYLSNNNAFVVSLSLKDKLSNSGNIGAIYVHQEGNLLMVDELCVSCRALGRGLESFMIGQSLHAILHKASNVTTKVRFFYRIGARNQPALNWLSKFTQTVISPIDNSTSHNVPELNIIDYPVGRLLEFVASTNRSPVKVSLRF